MTLAEVLELRRQGTNPCRHVTRYEEKARDRYLDESELKQLGAALRSQAQVGAISSSAANAVRLLLLTGARLNEVLQARWTWLDVDRRVLALPDSKTGPKPIFLSESALAVFDRQRPEAGPSEYIFPSPQDPHRSINLRRAWDHLREVAGLTGVRLHDLRHTAASAAAGNGVSLLIIGRLLGHSQFQTTQRYTHIADQHALGAAEVISQAVQSAIEEQ